MTATPEKKYTGRNADRRYVGATTDITYSLKRCIHAEQCIRHLRAVFDSQRRPWIEADQATADEVLQTVLLCPSGALHVERKDGGAAEAVPEENTLILWRNGPLQFSGDLKITGRTVEIESETRATLCRCGQSRHKPFCDNAHLQSGFTADIPAVLDPAPSGQPPAPRGGTLRISAEPNGSLHVAGNIHIINEQGETIFAGGEVWLCRCGGSSNKPFCDSTHEKIGFEG